MMMYARKRGKGDGGIACVGVQEYGTMSEEALNRECS